MDRLKEISAAPDDVFGIPTNPMFERICAVADDADRTELTTLRDQHDAAFSRAQHPQSGEDTGELKRGLRDAFNRYNRAIWAFTEKYPKAEPKKSRDEIDISPKRMGSVPIVMANSDGLGLRATLAAARYGATPIIMQEKNIADMDRKLSKQAPKLWGAHPLYREAAVLTPDHTVGDYYYYAQRYEDDHALVIAGDRDHYNRDAEWLGIVGPHEIARAKGLTHKSIRTLFKPKDKVLTAPEGISARDAVQFLDQHGQGFLPITKDGRVRGVMSRASAGYQQHHAPHENPRGGLAYLVAIRNEWERDLATIRRWIEDKMVGIGFRFDRAHLDRGTKPYKFIAELRKLIDELDPSLELIVGNLVTGEAALRSIDAGATGLCVGIGPSPQCITRTVTGYGVPQIAAVEDVRNTLDTYGHDETLLIADGGTMDTPAHTAKVILAGADHAMGSDKFQRTRESSPEIRNFADKDKSRRRIVVAGNASGNVQPEAAPRADETGAAMYRRTQGPREEGHARLVPMNPEAENVREVIVYLTDGPGSADSFAGGDSNAEARAYGKLGTQTGAGAAEGRGRLSGDNPNDVI